jgi:hypothetical protein
MVQRATQLVDLLSDLQGSADLVLWLSYFALVIIFPSSISIEVYVVTGMTSWVTWRTCTILALVQRCFTWATYKDLAVVLK